MSFITDLFTGKVPLVGIDTKVAYDLQRVGIQGRPQYPDTDVSSLQRHYLRNEIVYAAIRAKTTAANDPRLIVQQRARGDEWAEIEGHPMRRLLMRPNPRMDEAAFTKAAITSFDTAGVFYAEKVRREGLPYQLWPLDPAKVAPIPRSDGEEDYEFKDGSQKVTIKGEDMLVWRNPRLTSRYHGLSPLAVCLGSVDADSAQTDFIREFFNNAGVPSGILKIKGRTVAQPEADAMKERWRQRFGRQWGRTHDIAVFDENAEYQKIGANLDELQSEVLREFTETRVCMVFGTPPLIIYAFAGLKRATYSNLKEAWRGFWDSTMSPLFKEWRQFLTWNLLLDFVSEDLIYGERIRLYYDMSSVAALQDDVNEIHTRARENFKAGTITLNEFRSIAGEAPDPAGDYYVRSLVFLPVPFGEPQETTVDDVAGMKRQRRHVATKALSARSKRVLERSVERVMGPYLRREYGKAVEAA